VESSIAIVNGNPAIAYHDLGGQRLLYVRASDPNGGAWNAPLPAVVDSGVGFVETGGSPGLVTMQDGKPAIFYERRAAAGGPTELILRVSTDANGNAWFATPTVIHVSANPDSGIGVAKNPAGMPAVAFCVEPNSGGMCNFAEVLSIDGIGVVTFNPVNVCFENGVAFKNPSLAFIGGRAAVTAYDETNQDLVYNIRW
jgi:hypothetical protein